MGDGMSFVFQIDSNTPGLDMLLSSLDKANVSMLKGHAGLKGIDEGSRKAGEGAKTLGGAFEKLVTNGLDPFLKRAESIAEFEFIREGAQKLLDFPGELAEKLKELGEDAILTAAKTERMGRAFENALGKEQGKEAFEYFDKIADKTEFTHEQIRGMGLELAKSGFKGEGLKNATAAIADLGSMSGNGEAGAQEATSALQRIITTGRIEARALVPFGIHKEQFLGELGKETGLSMKQVQKEMEAGKIPIETTLNSLYTTITNKTGQDLGGAGTAMADTLDARLAHLKEKPDLFFESLKDTKGFEQFSDFIGRLGDALDPDSALGKILSGAIGTAMDELGTTVDGLDLNAIFTEVGDVIKGLPDDLRKAGAFARDDLKPAAQAVWDIFVGVLDTINMISTTIKGVGIGIHDYTPVGALSDLGKKSGAGSDEILARLGAQGDLPSQGSVGGALAGAIPGFKFVEDQLLNPQFLGARIKAFAGYGVNDTKGYAQGVESSTAIATGAMSSMADATTSALKDAHEQHSPSALFSRIAEMDAEGYAIGMEGSADRISDAIDSTFSQPSAAPAVTGSTGPMTVVIERIEVNIEGSGGDPYEQGRLAARGMEDELELTLTRVVEGVVKRRGL